MSSLKKKNEERLAPFLQYFPLPQQDAEVSSSRGGCPCLDLQTSPQILFPGILQEGEGWGIRFLNLRQRAKDHNRQGLHSPCSFTGINTTFAPSPSAQHLCTRVWQSLIQVLTLKFHFQLKCLQALQNDTQLNWASACTSPHSTDKCRKLSYAASRWTWGWYLIRAGFAWNRWGNVRAAVGSCAAEREGYNPLFCKPSAKFRWIYLWN